MSNTEQTEQTDKANAERLAGIYLNVEDFTDKEQEAQERERRQARDAGDAFTDSGLVKSRYKAHDHLMDAVQHGKDWNWTDAGQALARAYKALGLKPPACYANDLEAGTAWHRGDHPIQRAIAARKGK